MFLGTALYPNLTLMKESILAAQVDVITVSLRRCLANKNTNNFWDYIKDLNCKLLPNTAGCHNAKEAVYTANIARDLFETNWIKLEVIGDEETLQPNCFELLKACEQLVAQDFLVLPYCTDDLIVAQHLVSMGCQILMPWAAPIGSGKGLLNPYALKLLRQRFANIILIIDAGLGTPSHATAAMELGFDAVLLNSAVALANDPVKMAHAFNLAVKAGRAAFEAGRMQERDFAQRSTPLFDQPIFLE
jgi:thiazole synthase